jgi:hypothetical protein
MWGSVETTVKLAFTGLAGFTLACVVIETAGTAIGSTVAGSSESGYFVTRTLVELLLALYVADFVTGLIHMLLDFQTVDDDELRLHVETSVEAVEAFEKTKLFTEASEHDQYLWTFHSHHEAVYPSSDSQLELFMQLFWYVRIVWPLFYLGYYYGYVPEATSRVWLVALIVGLPSQQTHFLAHARRRGLLKEWPILEKLQDWRIILHPDAHQQHHEKFNCNFCILNGWANPVMNRVARLLTHFGVLAEEPPTARNRRERAERKDAALKEREES